MADKLTAKQMLDYINQWNKDHEGNYSPGDRQIRALFKDVTVQLSRIAGIENSNESPGSKAAVNAIQENKRDVGPGGSQYDKKETEPSGTETQPKTFEEARAKFDEAHAKFMEQVGAGDGKES